jgi:hypothetical protein
MEATCSSETSADFQRTTRQAELVTCFHSASSEVQEIVRVQIRINAKTQTPFAVLSWSVGGAPYAPYLVNSLIEPRCIMPRTIHHPQPSHAIRKPEAWGWLMCDIRTAAFSVCPASHWGHVWPRISPANPFVTW